MIEQQGILVARLLHNAETCFLKIPRYSLLKGDTIVIETVNGPELAVVSGKMKKMPEGVEIGKIIRRCTQKDLTKMRENEKREKEAFQITLEKIKKYNLDMKLVSIHCFLNNSKMLFNFTADERVDFRELVKELASVFKTRIELRQIGARDEAKIVKGLGICGREFCCNAIKSEIQPVTIRMAKDQNLTLNSSKISGSCGRLLCCLAYEHEAYCETKKRCPREGTVFKYDGKTVTLREINILKKEAVLKTKDEISIHVPLSELPEIKDESRQESCEENSEDLLLEEE